MAGNFHGKGHEPKAHPMRDQPKRSKSSAGQINVTVAVVYTLVVLGMAVIASGWLYGWAQQRIVGESSLADLANFDFLIPNRNEPPPLPADGLPQGEAAQNAPEAEPVAVVPPVNILLLGTDSRPSDIDIPRTDTMMLVSFDAQNQTAGMLSLPRDLWVPIPGLGYETKINTAFQIGEQNGYSGGGAQLAKDTVSSFIGQPVQYYAMVNFQGFVEIVDLIGGVEINVPLTIYDEQYPTDDGFTEIFYLEAGPQHLNGLTALKYVRTRNMDDDYGRAGRQQQVIRAVADKVLRADMLPTLLPRLPQLLSTMRNSIQTDIPPTQQLELANYVTGDSLQEIRQLVLDSNYGVETYAENGAWILLPDRTRVRTALAEFFAPPTQTRSSVVAQADPDWVRIEILNGTGEPGVAAATRDLLQSQGWQVVSIGDADRSDYGRTLIINYGVSDELVQRVTTDLELEPNLSSLQGLNVAAPVDVRIVVGRDFLSRLQ